MQGQGLSGLTDAVLHPRFADDRFVYLSYTKPVGPQKSALALARGRWDGKALTQVQDIFVAEGTGSGDKIDILHPGSNYGWPVSSYGRTYPGPKQSDAPWQARFEQPVVGIAF